MVKQTQGGQLLRGPRLGQWWALEQQRRRRKRLSGGVAVPDLMRGLTQFYLPQNAKLWVPSFNESVVLSDAPFSGKREYEELQGSGSYQPGTSIWYLYMPYVVTGGVRTYFGLCCDDRLRTWEEDGAIHSQDWSEAPTGVTGFMVVRWVDFASFAYRDFTVAQMAAGWSDNGSAGWTAGLPFSFASPPKTAKVMWSLFQEKYLQGMPTVPSPLGGRAFDSTAGSQMVRHLSDDARRLTDSTMAFWFCPEDATAGIAATVRGVSGPNCSETYDCDAPALVFGTSGEIVIADHTDGDWYLVVQRNDFLENKSKLTMMRMGGEVVFEGSIDLQCYPLTEGDDYFTEGIQGLICLGDSFHWSQQGYGYFDRLGLWDRCLSEEEILDLFNLGLGWMPGS